MADADLVKRVSEIEMLVFDIPRLVSQRLETLNVQLSEQSTRLNLLDTQMSMLLRDVRDLRGGVTNQLIHQDHRLNGFDERLNGLGQRMAGVEQRLDFVDRRLDRVDQRLDGLDQRLDRMEQKMDTGLAEVLRRLPGG